MVARCDAFLCYVNLIGSDWTDKENLELQKPKREVDTLAACFTCRRCVNNLRFHQETGTPWRGK